MAEYNEERELEPFVRQGTEEERIEVAADEVLNAIAEGRDIDIAYAVINGDLNIGKIKNRLDRDQSDKLVIQVNVKIQYSEIRGHTTVIFAAFSRRASFIETSFSGGASFSQTTFSGDVSFTAATFSGGASFTGAIFSGRYVDFVYTTFSGKYADFTRAIFSGEAVSFIMSIFSGDASFSQATFSGFSDFTGATFDGGTFFKGAIFSGYPNFAGAAFSGRAFFNAAILGEAVSFSEATFSGYPDFSEATFRRRALFNGTTMKHPANFSNVRFPENTVFVGLWNHILHPLCWPIVWLLTIGKKKLWKRMVTDFLDFNTAVVMDGSSNPYLKRYIEDEQWIASWWKRDRLRKVLFLFWELTCHCGRSFGLWLFWSLVVAVVFGGIYADCTVPSWFPQPLKHLLISMDPHLVIFPESRIPTQFTPFYFSIVTFTTLGFGDVTPLNLAGEIWLTLEVFIGYIMLGGLISIFANKLARRA